MTSGAVSRSSLSKSAGSVSASVGAEGVGTRKPKDPPDEANFAERMKCSTWAASSQTMSASSPSMRTDCMGGGAAAHAWAGEGSSRSAAVVATTAGRRGRLRMRAA